MVPTPRAVSADLAHIDRAGTCAPFATPGASDGGPSCWAPICADRVMPVVNRCRDACSRPYCCAGPAVYCPRNVGGGEMRHHPRKRSRCRVVALLAEGVFVVLL